MIPAFRELANLAELIPAIRSQFENAASLDNVSFVIVPVVEIGSPDVDVITHLGATPVVREPGDLFGDAMRTGLAEGTSRARYVLVMDADGSHSPATIPRLWEAMTQGSESQPDIVVASRYVAGGSTANALPLRVMSRALNIAYGLVLSLDVRDISTNFKIYRSEILQGMELESSNFDIVEEILAKALFATSDLRIVEIPDHFHERLHGESRRRLGPFVVTYLLTLLRLRVAASRAKRRER